MCGREEKKRRKEPVMGVEVSHRVSLRVFALRSDFKAFEIESDMSCPRTVVNVEEVPLSTTPGSGDAQTSSTCCEQDAGTCRNDRHHRKLAICSIICGISCIGIMALINSVKAESTTDPKKAERFSRQARKFGIISIVTWLCILASFPLLLALLSYLATLVD
ncbi:hypothetical protein Q5P01_016963 [Channa striata]|uniref:Transmembrane protein 265 n=1 Tax=Channa striata TaxID=64152 RepID=A0AA88SAZ1_CHASR|nr:hypothetical protein Q5P01_016963 [Channa striata]